MTTMTTKLALHGGEPVRTRAFPAWPVWGAPEEEELLAVLHSGKWWRFAFGQGVELIESPDGERGQIARFQEAFAQMHDCRFGIAAANGTATLEVGLRALDFGIGDEVIVPAYTYIASATCVLQNNLVPIFVDVDPETYNLDPRCIEAAITPRTRAIIVVHFGGQPCDMEAIQAIAVRHGLTVIEDAAHAHGCEWQGHKAGSFGRFSSFSFQASKNMTCGEGGIICTNDQELAAECEALLWVGRKVGRPWYEFHRLGWNYRLTEFQGALLRGQMTRLAEQNLHRQAMGRVLNQKLSEIEGISPLAFDPRTTIHGFHLYIFRYDEQRHGLPRGKFLQALAAEGIPASAGYTYALYKNPLFLNKRFINGSFPLGTPYHEDLDYGQFAERCPVAERACAGEAVWLPQNVLLGDEQDMEEIAAAVRKVLAAKNDL